MKTINHTLKNRVKKEHRFCFLGIVLFLGMSLSSFAWGDFRNLKGQTVGTANPPSCIFKKIKERREAAKAKTSSENMDAAESIAVVDNNETASVNRNAFTPIEQMPSFPGGEKELLKFLSSRINYPKMSKETGVTGTVYVEFTIDIDGSLKNIEVVRGVASDIDKEAVRLVNTMPKWIPGSQRNKPVQVEMRLPIRFTLG